MLLTAVVCGRNDNYGGHLLESAAYALNSMLKSFDEVIFVDWNTEEGKPVVTDSLVLENRQKLRTFEVRPSKVKEILGDKPAQPMCEVLARNIGIRRAKGDIVVSTNIDIIVPPREQLELLFSKLRKGDLITMAKQDVELEELRKGFGEKIDVQEYLPLLFGVWPLQKRLMQPHTMVNKAVLEKYPERAYHTISSLICACGDFQAAHKETWHAIKGFEEDMTKRLYNDTTVQYQVIMSGGSVYASNFPPVYHIEHARTNTPDLLNKPDMNAVTKNGDDWGLQNYFD